MSKVRSDNITNRADDGAPKFVFGAEVPVGYGITGAGFINVSGVSTFSGNVSIAGTLTYEDVTNVDSVGLITARKGIISSGVVTATTAHLDAESGDTILQVEGGTNGDGTLALAGTGTGISKISFWDQLALGKTAGGVGDINTESLRIDSSGRILHGITSAKTGFFNDNNAAPVHQIQGSTYYTTAFSIFRDGSGASGPNFILAKGREAIVQDNDILGTISFQGHDGTTELIEGASIVTEVDGTPGANDVPSALVFNTNSGTSSTAERLRITSGGTAIFKAGLAEKVNVKSQLTSANACAITDGNVILTTTNEPGNTYPDITGVHSVLSSGQGFSVTIALKVNGSGTINGFRIDGQAQTVEWSGGSAPSAGSSGYDVFTFSAFKTGSGATDYTVFGAATNYD